jgi:two-component system nitrogen regulation sensor histidine kinase GlnL
VILNLLLNAIQAIERLEPSQAPRITLRSKRIEIASKPMRCLGIEDNGPGIDALDLEQIFLPYYTTRAEGSGLGLSISNHIVEAHQGFLDVEAQPGSTTFWICLPEP